MICEMSKYSIDKILVRWKLTELHDGVYNSPRNSAPNPTFYFGDRPYKKWD